MKRNLSHHVGGNITGCSSPPPPVPVAWDKAADH